MQIKYSWYKNFVAKVRLFFKEPQWRYFNLFPLALRGYVYNNCQFHASALTLYTIFGFVPILALAFGVAKGFGVENFLREQIIAQVPQQEIILQKFFGFAQNLLERTKGGVMIGIGLGLLFWSLLSILWQIESIFNRIWDVKKFRNLSKMIADYFSVVVILPILLATSASATIFVSSQLRKVSATGYLGEILDSALSVPVKILPYFIIWILFTFLYLYMPNRKVKFKYAVIAGVMAGSLYQITQYIYLWLQIGISSYNAIYGSFAAIPLFLIWIRTSWMIILYGAEFSFVLENYNIYYGVTIQTNMSFKQTFNLSSKIVRLIGKNFNSLDCHVELGELSKKLRLQKALVLSVLEKLISLGILVKIDSDKSGEYLYTLAMPMEKITNGLLLERLALFGENKQITV